MKIAYVCHWNPFVEDGVVRKIRAQSNAWQDAGAEAEIFCLSAVRARNEALEPHLPGHHFLYGNAYVGRANATMRLARAVRQWKPDVIYLRYSLFVPPPALLMRRVRTVIEINSDDRAEYDYRSRLLALYNNINHRILFKEAMGFVCITPELVERVVPAGDTVRSISITNGIDLEEGIPLAPSRNVRPRLVFLGTPEPWHGIDKVMWLASALPEFDFDLVGKQDAIDIPIPANVRAHGFLERQDYEAILAASDVALGTLALHRIGVSEAAPLKVREYLLRGIPVIIGYKDPDLSDDPWFVLRLPNTENNLRDGVREIREFVRAVAGKRVERHEVAHRIDASVKERARLAFLEKVACSRFR